MMRFVINPLRRHVVASVCLGISLLAAFWIIWRSPQLDDESNRLLLLERELRQIRMNAERARGLEEDIEVLGEQLETVAERLVDPNAVALNYEIFLKKESLSGVTLEAFTQEPLPEEPWKLTSEKSLTNYLAVPFTLEVLGEYGEIVHFLELLEGDAALLRLDYIAVDLVKEGKAGSHLRAQVVCHLLGKKDD
jgi:hypothetical protein